MIWVSVILLILKLIALIPEIIDLLTQIFGTLGRGRPLQIARDIHKVHDALKAKMDQAKTGSFAGPCPLLSVLSVLEAKYGTESDEIH